MQGKCSKCARDLQRGTSFRVRAGGAGLRAALSLKVLIGAIVSLLSSPSTQLPLMQAGVESVLSIKVTNTAAPDGSLRPSSTQLVCPTCTTSRGFWAQWSASAHAGIVLNLPKVYTPQISSRQLHLLMRSPKPGTDLSLHCNTMRLAPRLAELCPAVAWKVALIKWPQARPKCSWPQLTSPGIRCSWPQSTAGPCPSTSKPNTTGSWMHITL